MATEDRFVPRCEVLERLGVHYQTLYNMVKRGDIETIKTGRIYKYNLDKFLRERSKRARICYISVESATSQEANEKIAKIVSSFPHHTIMIDAGGNYNNFAKILTLIGENNIDELIIIKCQDIPDFNAQFMGWLVKKMSKGNFQFIENL